MKSRWVLILLFLISWEMHGQNIRLVENYSTQIGVTHTILKDTYLSPLSYEGFGLALRTEKISYWPRNNQVNTSILRQKRFEFNLISAENPAKTANEFGSLLKYRYGILKKVHDKGGQRLFLGGNINGNLDMLYHTQNSNNPFNMHLGIDLAASILYLRSFKLFKYPFRMRLQMDTPILGGFFMPEYGQSYYEMFSLNNHGKIIHFGSFHNQRKLLSTCSFDFDLWNYTLRLSWYNDLHHHRANGLKYNYATNTFTIGLVREFITLKSKKVKANNSNFSPFY